MDLLPARQKETASICINIAPTLYIVVAMLGVNGLERGCPYRVLYAFDPRRTAILLIGGSKKGNNRWYAVYVPLAEKLYATHLEQLMEEGSIDGKEVS